MATFFLHRSQYRPEMALEKEKIRKDYEALTQELAAITREENKIKAQTGVGEFNLFCLLSYNSIIIF
jgi:hypothetical protein